MAREVFCCGPQNSRQCQDYCLHTVTRTHVQPHTWNYIHDTKNNMGYNQMHFYKTDYSAANNVYYTIYYNRSFQHTTWYHHRTILQHSKCFTHDNNKIWPMHIHSILLYTQNSWGWKRGGMWGGASPTPPPPTSFFCFCVSENRHNIYIHVYSIHKHLEILFHQVHLAQTVNSEHRLMWVHYVKDIRGAKFQRSNCNSLKIKINCETRYLAINLINREIQSIQKLS